MRRRKERTPEHKNRKPRRLFRLALCFVLSFSFAFSFFIVRDAMALRVTVKRIIFEGPVRSELITIINNTKEEQTYRLGWRPMRMTEDRALVYLGDTDPASVPGLRPAKDMIRYAPRRVVLPPGSSQKVRLMLRRPRDLEPGEYRSHFWIQPEAEAVDFDEREPAGDVPRVELKMLTGLTMPVIVRAGNLKVTGTISDMRAGIESNTLNVSMTIHRDGERSLYGDMKFYCDGELIWESRGISVYTEVNKRNIDFNIPLGEDDPQDCRRVSVEYVGAEEDALFRGGVIAEATAGL